MATIPTYPQGTTTSITLRSSAVDLTPIMGGPTQRISRFADRWILEVEMRKMRIDQAGPIVNSLLAGLSEPLTAPIVEGLDLSPWSDGAVSLAATGGTSLKITGGGAAKYVGQFFSIAKNGKRYLHRITSISEDNLSIFPALKTAVAVGDVLEFGAPKIQGFIDGNEQSWSVGLVAALGVSFKIVEAN
jgi:hypothetical protein